LTEEQLEQEAIARLNSGRPVAVREDALRQVVTAGADRQCPGDEQGLRLVLHK
jgi:hypothetical protein